VKLSGSIVALVTPMTEAGAIDYAALGRLIDFHVEKGTDGLVIAGTTGESATLTKEEHVELVAQAVRLADGRIDVIAGTGSNSTAQTIDLSRAVEKIDGVRAALVVTPYYNKPTQEGLYRHYTAIADAVDLPLVLYNVPGRTGCDMLPETVVRLAAVGNIVAIKEASSDLDRCRELIERCPAQFVVLSGDDPTALEFIRLGARGVISVTANVAPGRMHALCALALDGKFEEAEKIDAELAPLHQAMFVESNPIPAKWALARMGMIGAGIRLPLTPLSVGGQAKLEPVLKDLGLIA
jgi:4-hydroxy-tetrahydrodipicolinate synthase